MREHLTQELLNVGLPVGDDTAAALAEFLAELAKWNEVHNLTAITDRDGVIRRHIIESLALRTLLRGNRIADVGSGAGVPGIPLAIAEPEREFTLIESRGKRARFLRHVQGRLGLQNVIVEHSRVEDLPGVPPFDTVLARAVAALPELLRITRHLFGPDTVMLALTGESFSGPVAALDHGFEARRVEGGVAGLLRGTLVIVAKE